MKFRGMSLNVYRYYRGKRNLEAMRSSLMARGLKDATDVVISGCSAGGLATYFHVDWWADSFPSTTKVRGKHQTIHVT
jgi:hypothetical protein